MSILPSKECDAETIERVCRGVASTQECTAVRAYILRLQGAVTAAMDRLSNGDTEGGARILRECFWGTAQPPPAVLPMRTALEQIRDRLRGDPPDFESAVGEIQHAYHVANKAPDGSPAQPPLEEDGPSPQASLRGALRRLSQAMGNPAIQWDDRSYIETALVEEATRRLSHPPPDDDYWDWVPQGDADKAPPQFSNSESHAWASGFDAGVKALDEKLKTRPAPPSDSVL